MPSLERGVTFNQYISQYSYKRPEKHSYISTLLGPQGQSSLFGAEKGSIITSTPSREKESTLMLLRIIKTKGEKQQNSGPGPLFMVTSLNTRDRQRKTEIWEGPGPT
jgi:hypothetical protein